MWKNWFLKQSRISPETSGQAIRLKEYVKSEEFLKDIDNAYFENKKTTALNAKTMSGRNLFRNFFVDDSIYANSKKGHLYLESWIAVMQKSQELKLCGQEKFLEEYQRDKRERNPDAVRFLDVWKRELVYEINVFWDIFQKILKDVLFLTNEIFQN